MSSHLEQFQSLSDMVPALIAFIDPDLRYRTCNLAYARWFGVERDQIVGRTVREFVGEDVWCEVGPRLEAALRGENQEYEKDMVAGPTRTRRSLHAVYTPQFDASHRVTGVVALVTDVTARRRTEEALRESEERYRSLFDSIDAGFGVIEMIFDEAQQPVDYRFLEVNPAFEKQTGMQRPAGKRMREFFPSVESRWLEMYGRVALTGEPIRFAEEYKGLNRWFDVYAFRVGQAESRKVALLFKDITEQKRTETALRESEERFRNMSDHSPMMLWVTDAEGYCTHLNERWYEYTGQTAETGVGFGWLNAVHPEDRPRAEDDFRSANARRAPFRAEYRLRARDGSYRWAIDAASPRFSERGDFLGYIGSVIEIQERKEAEEALRKSRERFDIVKDGAQVGFWFCDLPFDVLEWDNRVKEHFWLQPGDVVPMGLFYARIHPDDREATRQAIAESIEKKTRYDIEYRTVQPGTGSTKWIRAIGRTFYDSADKPIRFDGVTLDVTERKRAETALREAKEQAERASRAKDEFLAQLSHELRTPLTPVLLTAQALKDDLSLPASAREQMEMIARNVALEARIIDDLLDLTRITHGKLLARVEDCDVHALLGLVVEILREEIRAKRIVLTVENHAEHSALSGDPARLQQLFWNLLRNAVKFTPEGGEVRIRTFDRETGPSRKNGRALVVEISDNGIGFESSEAARLFEPFERGEMANDHRFPGLGLGLAIAKAIIGLHGGTIRGESAGRDRGAVFTVEFFSAHKPVAKGEQGGAGQAAVAAQLEPRLRLLIVDDHAPTLTVISALLRKNGHQITTAANVADALVAAEKNVFDLVLSDLGLPDGSGIDLMSKLRERYGLKGIALSGYGMEEDMRRSAEAGFVAHLVKPVDLKEVRRLLGKFGRAGGVS